MSLSLNVVKEKEKEEDIEKKGQNENEGDIEESQVSSLAGGLFYKLRILDPC
jgi:hypothetical protein